MKQQISWIWMAVVLALVCVDGWMPPNHARATPATKADDRAKINTPPDPGITVVGRVLDQPGGKPAEGVTITLLTGKDVVLQQAVTDDAGRYRFPGVAYLGYAHRLRVGEHGPGVWTEDLRFWVAQAQDRLGKNIHHAQDLYTKTTSVIEGVVTDLQTGQAIAGVSIYIRTMDGNQTTVQTDANGAYRLNLIAREVIVYCDGTHDRYYAPPIKPRKADGADEADGIEGDTNLRSRTFTTKPGEVIQDVDFQLRSAKAFTGTLLLPDGQPAANLEVFGSVNWSIDHAAQQRIAKALQAREQRIAAGLEPPVLDQEEEDVFFRNGFSGVGSYHFLTTDENGRLTGYLRRPDHFMHGETSIDVHLVARTADLRFAGNAFIQSTTVDPPPAAIKATLEPCATAELTLVDPDGKQVTQAALKTTALHKDDSSGRLYMRAQPVFESLGNGRYRMTGLVGDWEYGITADAEGYRCKQPLILLAESGKHHEPGELRLDWWGTKAVPGLLKQLQSAEIEQRQQACEQLGQLGPDAGEAVAALIATMKNDPKHEVRSLAAKALGKIGDAAQVAIPDLIATIGQDDLPVQSSAIIALGHLRSQQVVPILIGELDEPDSKLHTASIYSLGQIAGRLAVNRLILALRETDDVQTKASIINALEQTKSAAALPALREAAQHPNKHIHRPAKKAIQIIEYANRQKLGSMHGDAPPRAKRLEWAWSHNKTLI